MEQPITTKNVGQPCVICGQAADAQATIAALQARVKELEQWVQDQSTANLETMRHMDEMQSRAMEAESQLTQRTAELEAAKREARLQKEGGLRERKVADSYHQDLVKCEAELERVRLLSSHNERRFEMLEEKYKDLRTLILALPKVEGEIEYVSGMGWVIKHNGDVRAIHDLGRGLVAALLKHRQGMEG